MTCDHFRQSMEWTFMLDNLNLGWVGYKTKTAQFLPKNTEREKKTYLITNKQTNIYTFIDHAGSTSSKMNTITMVLLPVGKMYLVNTQKHIKETIADL